MGARTKSSQDWLKRHFADPYVQKSWEDGWRSRAAYKLLDMQEKYKFLKKGMCIVDLGAAPGSWSEVAKKFIGRNGKIIAMDLLPMEPIEGVMFLQADFTQDKALSDLLELTNNDNLDFILCDISPNMSGDKIIDQPRIIYILELVLEFAVKSLQSNAGMLLKAFHGSGLEEFKKTLREHFKKVQFCKPKASRNKSREIYILATGFLGN
ncbi:MAG: 23S rRNA methyltransferase [Thiotrichales bacterium]|nr:MAG: 23S rRNA methyltransferase [Thiotrichales bacterium]